MTKSTRREFLKQTAATAAGIYGLGGLAPGLASAAGKDGKSRVVIARSPGLIVNSQGMLNGKLVEKVLGDAMVRLTGAANAEAAWKGLFSPKDVVGIKVNCLFGRAASTRPEVAMAVAAGLQTAGVKPENIIIWDRSSHDLIKAGYTICKEPGKVQCYGTDGDYEPEATRQGSFNGRLAKILTQKITALVNVPILKDHGMSGITLAMKNHYGSFHNPGAHHGNHCDPYCADANAVPVIREKTRLIVADLVKPICNGGPGLNSPEHQWDYKGLMVGFDPVATDTVGLQIIEEKRKEFGLPTLEQAGRPVLKLASAAARGLGTNDLAKIELVKI